MGHGKPKCGKSQASQAVICCALTGRDFLGKPVTIDRILVIDEENPTDVILARLRAMGYDDEAHRDRLYFISQSGFKIGQPDWNEELLDFVERYEPDLVVVDSMFRATNAGWQNETITPLFDVFRAIANRGAAVWLVHHDRKDNDGGDIHTRASGGDQWMAQIDRQIAFEQVGKMGESELDDGSIKRSFPIKLEGGHTRMGSPFPETYLSIVSESHPGEPDSLRRMWLEEVEKTSPASDGSNGKRPTWYIDKVTAVLENEPGLTFNRLHDAIGRDRKREYLRWAIDLLIEDGRLKVEPGPRNAQQHFLTD
jgi:hypothetical protein